MMMGLGSLGCGGPSSSSSSSLSSNLSALAPPFSVDRFHSKPSSNPLLEFPDLQPYAAPFGQSWQYSNPSAPRPDLYQKSELDIDSTRITSVPLPNDYGFRYSVSHSNDYDPQTTPWSTLNPTTKSSAATFSYDGKVESYYPPYVSSVVNNNAPLVTLSEPSYDMLPSSGLVSANTPSQVDYTQSLSGLEYTPQWHGGWKGLVDAKRGKHAELDVHFSFNSPNAGDSQAYGNLLNQGYDIVKCGDVLEKDSGISCGQFSDAIGRERNNGLVRMEYMDNMSVLAQNALSFPFDSSRLGSSFPLPASHLPGSSLHSPQNFMNYQKSQSPYDKCISSVDSSVSGSISVTKSSPAVVIRPPPSGSAFVPLKAASGKTINAANISAVHPSEGLGKNNPFKGKEPQILLGCEVEEGSLFTSQLNYQKEGNGLLFSVSSSAMEELSSKPQARDGVDNVLKVTSGLQVPNINVSVGSSLSGDSFQAFKSSDNVPDCLDHHSFAVDSPCWKGAPASQFSPFDVAETEPAHHFVKKIDKFCQLDLQVDQTFSLPNDPIRISSEEVVEDNIHECGRAMRDISLTPANTSEADCTAREHTLVDAIKARFKNSNLANSKGVQFCEEYNNAGEDYDLPKHSKNESESKSSGINQLGGEDDNLTTSELNLRAAIVASVLNASDTTEGAVAVRAAENVLCSPSSEDGYFDQAKPYGVESAPKMDVQAFIRALQSISELLLFNSLTDSCALKDQDLDVLKHVRHNLDMVFSKKIGYLTQSQERMLQPQDTCDRLGDCPDPRMSNAAGQTQCESVAGVKSHSCLDYQNTHEETGNHGFAHGKAVNFQPFYPLWNNFNVLSDDNMAQSIRKVLEENFHCGEDMESQALLFKNLWLEAEAKLCSISYRARFDRMKIEMQKFKSNQTKAASGNISSFSSSHDVNISDVASPKVENVSIQKTTVSSLPNLSSTSNANDVESSVMTRFHILKCRNVLKSTNLVGEESHMVDFVSSGKVPSLKNQAKDGRLSAAVEPHSRDKYDRVGLHIGGSGKESGKDGLSSTINAADDDVETTVMTRFHILKCRDGSKNMNLVEQQAGALDADSSGVMPVPKNEGEDGGLDVAVEPHSHQTGEGKHGFHVGGSGYESVRDFFRSVPDDPVTQSGAWNAQKNQYSLGFNDNSSSDWEHVVKDDVSWH
ncbi:hypothetical protein ACH5RR_017314 [Cinchona calisaya]|uniref:Uncharacterized protein n=1 Tax=Cinchona calisaya TaxID=153742 RepID=A0ABD2ZYE0_9GENT